jgi:hypothetical protein
MSSWAVEGRNRRLSRRARRRLSYALYWIMVAVMVAVSDSVGDWIVTATVALLVVAIGVFWIWLSTGGRWHENVVAS